MFREKLNLERETQWIKIEWGFKDEGLDLRFWEKFHESLKSRNAISSLVIFFLIVKVKFMFKNIIKFRERNVVQKIELQGIKIEWVWKF
jgi:hypothetical protein